NCRVSGEWDVECLSPNRKKTGTTDQALLTNHKPEPHVRRLPSESIRLATPLYIYCSSFVSFSGWLPVFPSHAIGTQRDA
uniref:SRCR domain-containing protein n=1 Tax=Mesocestoides corti TaxID=53468 RepID=A0A5K3FS59_MESCO